MSNSTEQVNCLKCGTSINQETCFNCGKIHDFYKIGIEYYEKAHFEEAYKWFDFVAEQSNDARAQNKLGNMYYSGKGVGQDNQEAAKWYKKAAKQGYAKAQFILALMYEKGKGVAQDYEEAIKWYKKAADQDDVYALVNLGYMYEKGKGVEKDNEEAAKWFKKAEEQGS